MPDLTRGHTFTSGEEVDHTKLNNLTGNATINDSSITNAKVSASAALSLSKLEHGTTGQVVIASSGGVQTSVSLTGDVTVTYAGVTTIGAGRVTSSMLGAGVGGDFIPVGSLMAYAGTSAPTGWLICDGTEKNSVSDTTLADLYTAIGTRYGGSSASAFNLPDMRGRVAVAADGSAGRLASDDAAGESGGTELHTLTEAEMPSHNHAHAGGYNFLADGGGSATGGGGGIWGASHSTVTTVGDDNAHNNMQPYQVVDNYIIKT